MGSIQDEVDKQKERIEAQIKTAIQWGMRKLNTSKEKQLAEQLLKLHGKDTTFITVPKSVAPATKSYCMDHDIPFYLQYTTHSNPILILPVTKAAEVAKFAEMCARRDAHFYKDQTAEDYLNNQTIVGKTDVVDIRFKTREEAQTCQDKLYNGGYGEQSSIFQDKDGDWHLLTDQESIYQISNDKTDILDVLTEMAGIQADSISNQFRPAQAAWDKEQTDKFINSLAKGRPCTITDGLSATEHSLSFDGNSVFLLNAGKKKLEILNAENIKALQSGELSPDDIRATLSRHFDKINNLQFMTPSQYATFRTVSQDALDLKKEQIAKETVGYVGRKSSTSEILSGMKAFKTHTNTAYSKELNEELLRIPDGCRPQYDDDFIMFTNRHAQHGGYTMPKEMKYSFAQRAAVKQANKILTQELREIMPENTNEASRVQWNKAIEILNNPKSKTSKFLSKYHPSFTEAFKDNLNHLMDNVGIRDISSVRQDVKASSFGKGAERNPEKEFEEDFAKATEAERNE